MICNFAISLTSDVKSLQHFCGNKLGLGQMFYLALRYAVEGQIAESEIVKKYRKFTHSSDPF
jgi:hypothetical protein